MKKVKCRWCPKRLSKKERQATIKEPNTFYCNDCYKKGLEAEYEAMGIYDEPTEIGSNQGGVKAKDLPFYNHGKHNI